MMDPLRDEMVTELTMTKPVRGPADLWPRVAAVPGFEIFLPRPF